ncbi:unnamed protein product [Adineta ricciae]|uniref:Uncharacterized protein n=1 Tax=Adineta ricciae TaxID=249248 RepID=A0A813NNV8_ADIRI|nr:unnamed protein product [Adineta ricciae]CAF0744328.1 unnamed protein product [Adineta ricciae]
MSGTKIWPELVGRTFQEASLRILAFDNRLHPYNARNGMENRMLDPHRVVCVTNDADIVTTPPQYTYR